MPPRLNRRAGIGRRSRLARRATLTLVGAVAGSVMLGASGSGADGAFTAFASADGFRLTMTAVGGPATSTPVDGGGPVTQATLDSLGTSRAFASWVYPGDVAVAGPGLLAGFSGGKVNLPAYPLIAQSDAATKPDSDVSGGGASVRAASTPDRSESTVTAGALASDSVRIAAVSARSTVGRTGSELRADAANEVDGLAVGPLVLGQVRSHAGATRSGQPDVTRASDLRITGGSVNGTPVEIGPDGITLAGSGAPLPAAPPVGDQLREAGITLTYLAPQTIDGGVISAGLLVRIERAVPGPVTPVALEIRLGRSMARLEGGPIGDDAVAPPDLGSDSPAALPSPPDPLGEATDIPATADVAAMPVTTPASASASSSSLAPVGPASPPALPSAAQAAAPAPPAAAAFTTRPAALFDTDAVYLAVALGGLAVAVCARLVSRFGK